MTATILVADDDAAIRTVLNQALSRAGYDVRITSNAATLWRWVSAGEGDLVVAFFGDGAIATGAFHEAMNMAALWKLPIIFLCENNGFSEFSSTVDQHPVPISARAAGYGMKSITLAGNDVEAVAERVRDHGIAAADDGRTLRLSDPWGTRLAIAPELG